MQQKRRKKWMLWILAIFLLLWGYLSYWALFGKDYYYFPENNAGGLINLGLFASWPNNALDYYPGGYGIYVRKAGGERKLTQLDIKNPALHTSEIYSGKSWCTAANTPIWCWSIHYVFSWKWFDGKNYTSSFPVYDMNSDYVNVISLIKKNARYEWRWAEITGDLKVSDLDPKILMKVRFSDDVWFWWRWNTVYKDISKKFSLRVLPEEVRYIWVAASEEKLFLKQTVQKGDVTFLTWQVLPEEMYKLNFASVHLAGWAPGDFIYKARVDAGKNSVNIITVDMDNQDINPNSNPQMRSYIDVYLMKEHNGSFVKVDKDGVFTNQPIWRISPEQNGNGIYPATNTAWTTWSKGPSGTFLGWPVWSSSFVQRYYDQNNAGGNKMWVSQHRLTFTASTEPMALLVEVKNASTYVGNAFAIASDVDMFASDVPDEEISTPDEDAGNNNSTWSTVDGLKWVTFVEIDRTEGVDFSDNGKDTQIQFIHTYKTELCNTSTWTLTNVMAKLHLPNNTVLVWTEAPWDTTKSSLMLSGSMLDTPVDNAKKLPVWVFSTDISLWDFVPGECQFLTYQADINPSAADGDEFIVQNEFKYGSGTTFNLTNEVKNVLRATEDVSISLESNPISGSDVFHNDFIEYRVTVKNEGNVPVPPGKVTCPRMLDTAYTFCKIWECKNQYDFDEILVWEAITYSYIVEVRDVDTVPANTVLLEQCKLNDTKDSNEVNHIVKPNVVDVKWGWQFSLFLNSRPKLLNTPDGNPRPDGYDRSPIEYTYRYSGSNLNPMYPQTSDPGSYVLSRGWCGPTTLPYKPNAYSFNVNSSSTSPMSYLNPTSNNLNFGLNTTLPASIPKTTLYNGSLTPTHFVPGSELNSRYKSWGDKVLPITATEHRALVNGTNGRIEANITWTARVDRWQYRAYSTQTCSYTCWCGPKGCRTCSVSYPIYRWEVVQQDTIPFTASNFKSVTVWWSTAWIKTEWSHVHTNQTLNYNWSSSNTYNLWESWYNWVTSSPKLYSPPGTSHGEYVVSSNSSSSNLKSEKNWYVANKKVPMWHGYVYDREKNPRDFYTDLIEGQKFGKVVRNGPNPIRNFDMELNHVYYYPGDLTINNPAGTTIIWGFKGTIVVEGDLYIRSNIKYSKVTRSRIEDLPYLWLFVKGNVYISPNVVDTTGTWFVEGTLHTGESVQTLRHFGSWTAGAFDFQRKAPEFYERDVNEPSEWIMFNDQVYKTTPPWFGQLDDGIWSYNSNINQFTWDEVDY